jgi:hypothetical protein
MITWQESAMRKQAPAFFHRLSQQPLSFKIRYFITGALRSQFYREDRGGVERNNLNRILLYITFSVEKQSSEDQSASS